jgi:hypothetical protein
VKLLARLRGGFTSDIVHIDPKRVSYVGPTAFEHFGAEYEQLPRTIIRVDGLDIEIYGIPEEIRRLIALTGGLQLFQAGDDVPAWDRESLDIALNEAIRETQRVLERYSEKVTP